MKRADVVGNFFHRNLLSEGKKRGRGDEYWTGPIEHELTMHLERAHELAERAKRSNGAVRHEIDRAREIANALYDEFHPPAASTEHRR